MDIVIERGERKIEGREECMCLYESSNPGPTHLIQVLNQFPFQ